MPDYLDRTLAVFDRELQFYLSYLEYIAPLREAGLPFSYPCISAEDKSEQALDTFDLALAAKRIGDGDGGDLQRRRPRPGPNGYS